MNLSNIIPASVLFKHVDKELLAQAIAAALHEYVNSDEFKRDMVDAFGMAELPDEIAAVVTKRMKQLMKKLDISVSLPEEGPKG